MNYVLFFPDEMRAESVGCYGHPMVQTPNIDALAAEGTLFEQAYTANPVCGPSRASLLSGWYPHVNGNRTFYLPTEEHPNMIAPLNGKGFTTAHAGKDDMFSPDAMQKIFTEKLPAYRGDIVRKKGLEAIREARYSMLYPALEDDDEPFMADTMTTDDAIDFIKRHAGDDNPFFLMVSWSYPHPPYTVPEKYYNMYDPEKVPMHRDLSWMEGKPEYYKLQREYRETTDKPETLFRKINAVYLGMISYIDGQIGRIVESLKEQGIYDDTTIILCSDHGDYAGDAGQVEKWPSEMSDMLARVPLVVRHPNGEKGCRVATPVQSMDILPTIMDYENIELDYLQQGVSLRPQIEGAPGDSERAAYTEGGYDTNEPWCFEPVCFQGTFADHPFPEGSNYYPKCLQQQERPESVCRVVMQRYRNWKLMVRTNEENELYNMDEDPYEKNNLYGQVEFSDVQNKMTAKMLEWMIHTSDVVPEDSEYRSGIRNL